MTNERGDGPEPIHGELASLIGRVPTVPELDAAIIRTMRSERLKPREK